MMNMYNYRAPGSWEEVLSSFVYNLSARTKPEFITGISVTLCHSNDDGLCCGSFSSQAVRGQWKGKALKYTVLRIGGDIPWTTYLPKFEDALSKVPSANVVGIQLLETPKSSHDTCLGVIFYVE